MCVRMRVSMRSCEWGTKSNATKANRGRSGTERSIVKVRLAEDAAVACHTSRSRQHTGNGEKQQLHPVSTKRSNTCRLGTACRNHRTSNDCALPVLASPTHRLRAIILRAAAWITTAATLAGATMPSSRSSCQYLRKTSVLATCQPDSLVTIDSCA